MRFIWFVICVLFLMTSNERRGHADGKTEARAFFEEGIVLQKSSDFKAALVKYERSYVLFKNKNTLYNIAFCYQEIGRYGDAVDAFSELLKLFGDKLNAERKAAVEAQLAAIRTKTGELVLAVEPDGAEVRIDNEKVGESPIAQPILLGPGDHNIKISKEGFDSKVEVLKVTAGVRESLSYSLAPMKAELTIECDEANAVININGVDHGTTPVSKPILLEYGDYAVSFKKYGYESHVVRLTLNAGEKRTVTVALKRETPTPIPVMSATQPPKKTVEPADEKNKNALFYTGLVGTASMAIASGALWGIWAHNWGEYGDKANAMENEWDEDFDKNAPSEQKKISALYGAAIGTSIATGLFAAVLAADFGMKKSKKRQESVSLRPTGFGLMGTF